MLVNRTKEGSCVASGGVYGPRSNMALYAMDFATLEVRVLAVSLELSAEQIEERSKGWQDKQGYITPWAYPGSRHGRALKRRMGKLGLKPLLVSS